MRSTTETHLPLVQNFLTSLLAENLPQYQFIWIKETLTELQNNWDLTTFQLAFGMTPRKIERTHLANPLPYQQAASAILPGWSPHLWTWDRIVRVLLLSIPQFESEEAAKAFIWDLFDTADMREQVAIFSALPTLPFPSAYMKIAHEGLRTNMAPVFDAIALENPFPATYFSQDDWNQMYLKAAFIERPIHRIPNIPQQANEKLSRIILDYVHERWAAGREVRPDFWQASTQFLSSAHIQALLTLAKHEKEMHRAVVELIRGENPLPELIGLQLTLSQEWTWENVGENYN